MFETQIYQYPIENWAEKKQQIGQYIKEENFIRNDFFLTDRKNANNNYNRLQ